MDLPATSWQDITWRNALRWLGRHTDAVADPALSSGGRGMDRR